MKSPALQKFRAALSRGESVLGLWVTLESATITEIAVSLGLDWVVIDAEHGHLDWHDILEHVRAAVRSDTVVLVRVTENNDALIKRVLDIGADGVVVPWVQNAGDLTKALSAAKYPTEGRRGIGAERATCWGQGFREHVQAANHDLLVVPIIESVEGLRNLPEIARVPGGELFFFGPADLSATAGYAGEWEGPGVAEGIRAGVTQLRAAGKWAGVAVTGDPDLLDRKQAGFQMLGLGLDAGLFIRQLRQCLQAAGRCPSMSLDLRPKPEPKPAKTILETAPENFRPDRTEVMQEIGGPSVSLEPGVDFEPLVGAHNGAINLTTGIVTFAGNGRLPNHRHTFAETITVLEGTLLVSVENRRYRLGPLDNLSLPAGTPHAVATDGSPCRVHIAMSTTEPSRELLDEPSDVQEVPDKVSGLIGPEHVVRFATARKYEAGPNTQFVDYFNAKLMADFPMSGGFGRFAHAGRLPAHIHDFDESITITEGLATCNVEGRQYQMSGLATALQPRGRIHYFINDTHEPMAMIWVYAGPMPERIEMAESLTAPGANPWNE